MGAVGFQAEDLANGALATEGGSVLVKKEGPGLWVVVCEMDGWLVADVKLTEPVQVRGNRKVLRSVLPQVLEVLDAKKKGAGGQNNQADQRHE